MNRHQKTVRLVFLAVLAAIVLLLQFFGGSIKVGPTSFSVVLIPITLGAMLLGPWAGAVLGLVFGIVVVVNGLTGVDPFTLTLIQFSPFMAVYTIVLCLAKGTLAGFVSGLLYRPIAARNRIAASFVAAAATPLVNTGIFALAALGLRRVFAEMFAEYGGAEFATFLFLTLIGVNFLVELAVNLVFAPALGQVVYAVGKTSGIGRNGNVTSGDDVPAPDDETDEEK